MIGRRRGKKLDANTCNATKSKGNSRRGATFLAVCRGKVSEGIDFSDENARAVIIVGIPFPNVFDIQVAEKKKYNDTYKSSKNLLSGSEWYCQQAFRALNQAAGRCIRHRLDYGAIIFLDERFRQERNLTYISKWIRKSIRHYDNFDQSLEGLKSFFRDMKVENNVNDMQPVDVESIDASRKKISPPPIIRANFDKVLMRQRPTVSKRDLELHERFTKEFGEALVKRAEKARKSVVVSSPSL